MKAIKRKILSLKLKSKFYRKIKNILYIFSDSSKRHKEPVLKELIPPLNLNYNWSTRNIDDVRNYESKFSRSYLNIISNLINKSLSKDIRSGKIKPRILDIGCGFGPLAIATKFMMESSSCLIDEKIRSDEIKYVGIDIRKDAIDWLRKAYKSDKSFYFHLHEAKKNLDYVGDKLHRETTSSSDGNECEYSLNFPFKADIQWSGSFFTHLTPQGVISALDFIKRSLDDDGIAVNTWLIADAQSCIAMKSKEADRYLPYDLGEFLTCSQENPLITTAYKKEFIERVYEEAELKIVEILLGSWRGFGNKNNFLYQDVIIAIPKSKRK